MNRGRRPLPAVAGLAVLAGLAGLAAGCGDDGGGSSATATTRAAVTTTRAPAATPTTVSGAAPTTVAGPTVADMTLTGGSEPDRYDYKVTYPAVHGLADATVEAGINDQVRTAVTGVVDQFVTAVKDSGLPPAPAADQRSSLDGGYKTARLDDRLASFEVTLSTYIAGAAHPYGTVLTLTFDVGTGQRLALADLFAPGAPYLATLSAESRLRLATSPSADPGSNTSGTEPTDANFAGWTVTEDALEITFAQGQVAASAAGMPHVSIPFASLRTLLDPDGPLAVRN